MAMRRAPVFRWHAGAQGQREAVRVGELTQQSAHWEFLYDSLYLARGSEAWELDPRDIRLKQRTAFTRPGVAPFPVFCDVALSGWSLDVLQRQRSQFLGANPNAEPWGWWERLLHAPADGFGALFVGEPDAKRTADEVLAGALDRITRQDLDRAFLESSSGAMGGERPKFTGLRFGGVNSSNRIPVMLKFALPSERADSVVAEATALTLGQQLGLTVPAHQVLDLNGTPALRIDRFDRGPGPAHSVFHCVSAATALGLVPGTDADDQRRSYVALRSRLKKPTDAQELFKRIVLNAAVGNTDDHPWNSSLRQVGLMDWELSPLYDVMPFLHRSLPPVFRMAITRQGARTGSLQNLTRAGREVAGYRSDDEAIEMIEKIFALVRSAWCQVFQFHAKACAGAQVDAWAKVFEPAIAR
jgi:serine/threonine-protein kinase HipA